jgi:Chaperone of endosialidase
MGKRVTIFYFCIAVQRAKEAQSAHMKTNTLSLILVSLLTGFALLQPAHAVVPAPDGGYPNFTTAEGTNALQNLTTGVGNTAAGWHSLFTTSGGNLNTAVGAGTLLFNTGDNNTATGALALLSNTTGSNNTANGAFALVSSTGLGNTATGASALTSNTTGNNNTASGMNALALNTTGNTNTASGANALIGNTTGSSNIALGAAAGSSLTTGNNNIDIGNAGFNSDSGTIRLGDSDRTRTFIAGIHGVTTGVADAIPVLIDSAGQLGTMSSSRRFKKDIQSMDKTSDVILGLKPVTFHYRSDAKGTPQFGLIAEEVAEVNPDLVVRDQDGEIYTVRYDAVNAMLLNEFQKEYRKNERQETTIVELKSTVAQQQKQIEALTAGLQKVSAQIEVSKPAPRTVLNNQ